MRRPAPASAPVPHIHVQLVVCASMRVVAVPAVAAVAGMPRKNAVIVAIVGLVRDQVELARRAQRHMLCKGDVVVVLAVRVAVVPVGGVAGVAAAKDVARAMAHCDVDVDV